MTAARSVRPVLLLATFAGLASCGARSNLGESDAGGGDSTSTTPEPAAGGAGGAVEIQCGMRLDVTLAADVDVAGGRPDRPKLVFGSHGGDVVSIFHAWSSASGGDAELHVTTLEPWADWPPIAGAHFTVAPTSRGSFAVSNVSYGNVALLTQHDPSDAGDAGLFLFGMLSATSPTGLVGIPLATPEEEPVAVTLVRGYDTPPVAFNIGYLATLATWDAKSATTGEHALRLAVSVDGAYALFAGTAQKPEDPELSCASAPIAADGVRSGHSWLVAAASGSELRRCSDGPSGPPESLVVDQLTWGAPDVVDWTVARTDSRSGDAVITRIRMAAMDDGAWVLVQRIGHPEAELTPVDPSGAMGDPTLVTPDGGASVVESAIAPISNGFLVAFTDDAAPDRIQVELRDGVGAVRANAAIPSAGSVGSLSILESMDGDGAIVGWMATDASPPRIQIARVACLGGRL